MDRERRIRAVLDTNVLLNVDRKPLLLLASLGIYTLIWSDFIRNELERKMIEIGWGVETSKALVSTIESVAKVVDHRDIEGGNYEDWLRDPDDHPIMATALAGKVDYLVTWNTKDFPPKKRFAGITIITPDAFYRRLL